MGVIKGSKRPGVGSSSLSSYVHCKQGEGREGTQQNLKHIWRSESRNGYVPRKRMQEKVQVCAQERGLASILMALGSQQGCTGL